ncbi:MAG: hypothetical protein Q7S79_01420 [bacterium]|nr:hypothetical protein [bacterium]
MEESTTLETPKPKSTRREFGKRLTAVAAVAVVPKEVTQANSNQAETKEPEKKSVWDEVFALAEEAFSAQKAPELQEEILNFRETLPTLLQRHKEQLEHTDRLWAIVQADKNDRGEPRLLANYGKFMGGLKTLSPGLENPISRLRSDIEYLPFYLKRHLEFIKDVQGTLDIKEQKEMYKILGFIKDQFNEPLPGEAKIHASTESAPKQQITIEMDENIEPSTEGKTAFEEHSRKIEKFLEKFPHFKKLYSRVVLTSWKYGEEKTPNSNTAAGTFSNERVKGEKAKRSVVWVNMGSGEDVFPEIVFAHEAFGHGLDVSINQELASRLTAKEYIERLNFQYEILNNPDWGNHDQIIPQLFDGKTEPVQDDPLNDGKPVSTERFREIIREYPRNIILHASYPPKGKDPVSICDAVLGKPDDRSWNAEGTKIENDQIMYGSLDEFCIDYLPKLEQEATKGGIRSRLILYGLTKFKKELGNTKGIRPAYKQDQEKGRTTYFVPHRNYDTATTWSNYCNFIVINAVVYHGFINGNEEIRSMFSDEEKRWIELRVFHLRDNYRKELFAEGAAFSHFLGDRVQEKPPYRVGLEHIANMIEKSSS